MAFFLDDFTRADSNTVGNGWTENELLAADLRILNNDLKFSATYTTAGQLRTGGYGRNNTTIEFSQVYGSLTTLDSIFTVSGNGADRGGPGIAAHGIHLSINSTNILLYDGTTLKASTGHGLTLATGVTYYVRLDIESDYTTRVYLSTNPSLVDSDLKMEVAAYTPTSTDFGYWELGGRDSIAINYFRAYDAVLSKVEEISLESISQIALTTATVNATIFSDGGSTITQRGVCYSTSPTPTIANSKAITSGTIGNYTVFLAGLSINTTYYIRAFYTNALGTKYSAEESFITLNIGQYELQKEIDANEGETFLGRINVTGTVGTITVKLGTTGTSTVIAAGAGNALFSGTYSGLSGLIITRSADFNGTIDDVFYVSAPLTSTVDWSLDTLTIITAIDSSVFFKRIEDDVFNSFRFYRYLDLLFKDLDGFVTVTIRDEREDITSERTKIFSVGNTETGTVSPFQKKKISFLIKNQAVIIGLSNAKIGETFSIAQFLLTGQEKSPKMFSPTKIISVS